MLGSYRPGSTLAKVAGEEMRLLATALEGHSLHANSHTAT